jgi:hypothetical protein
LRVRKRLLFILSVAMLMGGVYLLGHELLVTDRSGTMVLAGAALTFFGAYLLWMDFAAPLLGIRKRKN